MKILLLAYVFITASVAGPEVTDTKELDPRDARFPVPTEQFVGLSENGNGYTLKVERANRTCLVDFATAIQVFDTIGFSGHIEIHSLKWDGNGIWFLVKERIHNGRRAVAIAYCNPERNENHIILYRAALGSNENGRIIEIRGVLKDELKVYCRFQDPETTAIKYFEGVIKRSEMVAFSRLDFTKEYSKPSGWIAEPSIPLKRN